MKYFQGENQFIKIKVALKPPHRLLFRKVFWWISFLCQVNCESEVSVESPWSQLLSPHHLAG